MNLSWKNLVQLDYKQCLEDLAQKLNIVLPEYETTRDRSSEVAMYRSTVLVDGMSFTSEITYSLYPLERLLNKILPELLLRTYLRKLKIMDVLLFVRFDNTAFAKSALDEYAAKLNTRPTYNPVKLEGPPPCFECSVIFDATQYTGDTAKDKSEAEQLAARAVLLSILATIGHASNMQDHKDNIVATTVHASDLQDHKDKKAGTKRCASVWLANKNKDNKDIVATTGLASDQNHKR
ncbi:double-stranded RNA-binding protein 4 [Arachis duranensis]|uniref:Double-stranded RNA-binding protein 4 n=1 Tax=Arachis duranensis TaxID=130453 RepID=A0A9C6TT18_ARADU|nr:double-stranded RNA-binding protein 4 [Arachis duranensis]